MENSTPEDPLEVLLKQELLPLYPEYRRSGHDVSLVLGSVVSIEKITSCLYSDTIRESIGGLIDTLYDTTEWIRHDSKEGVGLWRREKGGIRGFRGMLEIDAPLEKILNICCMTATRFALDCILKRIELVEMIDNHCQIWHMIYETKKCRRKSIRDYCVVVHWFEHSSGNWIISFGSIEHPKCPISHKIIRGTVFFIRICDNSKEGRQKIHRIACYSI